MEWPEVEEKIKRSDYLNTQEIEATFEHIMNFKTQQPEQWKLISGDNQDPFVTTQFQNLYGVEFRNGEEASLIGEIGNGVPLEKQHGIIPEIQKSLIKGEPPSLILNELVIQLNKQPEVDDSLKMRILNASVNFLSGMEKVSVRNLNPEYAPPYAISQEDLGESIETTKEPIRRDVLDEAWYEKYQGNLGLFDNQMKNFKTEEEYDAYRDSLAARRDSIQSDYARKSRIQDKEDWKKTWEWIKGENTKATTTRSLYGGIGG